MFELQMYNGNCKSCKCSFTLLSKMVFVNNYVIIAGKFKNLNGRRKGVPNNLKMTPPEGKGRGSA